MTEPEKRVGECMRCHKPTTRSMLVGYVCETCATEVDTPNALKRIRRAVRFLIDRIKP